MQSYFLHWSIFCLGIYMSVSKPWICFWKRVISIKWRNKLLIHSIDLTGHRKSACCLQLLVFLEIWVLAPFWHRRTEVFPKGGCHHDLKDFCQIGYKSVLFNVKENTKSIWVVYYFIILFCSYIYPSCEWTLKNRRVKSEIVRKSSFGDMIF